MQLTRDLYVPLIDKNLGKQADTYDWIRIDKSTQYEFSWNPNTEERSYICYKNDSTEVTGYAPELPLDIVLDSENPAYELLDQYLWSFPTGTNAMIPVLLVRPSLDDGTPTVGLLWKQATVVGDTLNTVDGALAISITFNGDPIEGTVSGIGTEKVTFTPKA